MDVVGTSSECGAFVSKQPDGYFSRKVDGDVAENGGVVGTKLWN